VNIDFTLKKKIVVFIWLFFMFIIVYLKHKSGCKLTREKLHFVLVELWDLWEGYFR